MAVGLCGTYLLLVLGFLMLCCILWFVGFLLLCGLNAFMFALCILLVLFVVDSMSVYIAFCVNSII